MEVNNKLIQDIAKLSKLKFEDSAANKMKEDLNNNQNLINKTTGEGCSKQEALAIVEKVIDGIKNDLNQITNNGQNVKDIFTNNYYINDPMEDKRVARNNNNNFLNN